MKHALSLFSSLLIFLSVMYFYGCNGEKERSIDKPALSRYIDIGSVSAEGYSMLAIHQRLFEGLKKDELHGYSDPAFKTRISKEHFESLTEQQEIITYYPEDNHWFEKDSVIATILEAGDIISYRLVEDYQRTDDNTAYTARINGIAMIYSPYVDGIKRSSRPLVYLQLSDVRDFLGEEAYSAFQAILVSAMNKNES